jgi:hypothetical protein
MAIAAEERALAIGLERELGDLGAALGTGPIALHHGPGGPEVSVLHYFCLAGLFMPAEHFIN